MSSFSVEVVPELVKLPLKVARVPKGNLIEEFPPDGSDQSFDEGMGQGHVWNSLDLCEVENPQIGLPLAILEEWIMIRAELVRQRRVVGDSISEQAAYRGPIERPDMNCEAYDSSLELIHDDHYPVRP